MILHIASDALKVCMTHMKRVHNRSQLCIERCGMNPKSVVENPGKHGNSQHYSFLNDGYSRHACDAVDVRFLDSEIRHSDASVLVRIKAVGEASVWIEPGLMKCREEEGVCLGDIPADTLHMLADLHKGPRPVISSGYEWGTSSLTHWAVCGGRHDLIMLLRFDGHRLLESHDRDGENLIHSQLIGNSLRIWLHSECDVPCDSRDEMQWVTSALSTSVRQVGSGSTGTILYNTAGVVYDDTSHLTMEHDCTRRQQLEEAPPPNEGDMPTSILGLYTLHLPFHVSSAVDETALSIASRELSLGG